MEQGPPDSFALSMDQLRNMEAGAQHKTVILITSLELLLPEDERNRTSGPEIGIVDLLKRVRSHSWNFKTGEASIRDMKNGILLRQRLVMYYTQAEGVGKYENIGRIAAHRYFINQ